MPTRTLLPGVLLGGALLFAGGGPATPARAQTQNANASAIELLDKAANLVNLRDGTSGLFHLKAHVRLYGLAHNAAAHGTYTLDWAAPGRWRE